MHEPIRFNVFIAAPEAAVDAVLAMHASVRDLVTNGWVFLHAITTMHGKEHAIAPALCGWFDMTVTTAPGIDTDTLGTFTREARCLPMLRHRR